MTDVHVEEERLDRGIPVMYRDLGTHIRMAYDPQQTSEAAAVAILCVRIPRLADAMRLRRLRA